MNLDRRKARQMKAVTAGMLIQQRMGGGNPDDRIAETRIAALAAVAECRALWRFMRERGLATEQQYEDYLDKGYDEVLAQVESAATDILVHDGKKN
jgi:hypothetical protein